MKPMPSHESTVYQDSFIEKRIVVIVVFGKKTTDANELEVHRVLRILEVFEVCILNLRIVKINRFLAFFSLCAAHCGAPEKKERQ
jgi:hypothetical protein